MEGRRLRDRDAIALDLVGALGLSAFVAGLTWLRTSENLGFDATGAVEGVLSQLPVTLPAAILMLGATALELAAGLVLARAARRRPFASVGEALLAAMLGAVLKDALLLGTLAAFGLFRAPVLIGIDVALIAGAVWLPATARRILPLTTFRGPRDAVGSIGSIPIGALVAIVWAGPVVLQLASPVVPFIDVLPNYVGPVEHLRTFGWFEPLTATQSPIYGSSRSVLGYDGLLGSLATMTGLPGGLALAGFILPETVLLAAGAHRLASALANGDAPPGPWALLAFALSQPFARLTDARGTVVVFPLVCLGLAVAAEAYWRSRRARELGATDLTPDPWSIGSGAVVGLALGAATLVHPVIGFFAVVTVGLVGLLRPHGVAAPALVAGLTAGLISLPQLATMVGFELPTIALGIWLPVAVAAGVAASRLLDGSERTRATIVRIALVARIVLGAVAVAGVVLAFGLGVLIPGQITPAFSTASDLTLESSGIVLIVLLGGILVGSRGARSEVVVVGLAVGVVAVFLTQVLPGDLGFLGDALRFEVPKTVHYWLSAIAAAGAAAALAHAWSGSRDARLPRPARVAAVGLFVTAAALPVRPEPIDAYHLGEHRWSETFSIDLRFADTGFWRGYPDARTVVDEPRRAILDALRAEIDSGRLVHDTQLLHVVRSFQQSVATPLGVFDGVTETVVSLDPEHSHHTVGGRLLGLEALPTALDPAVFAYVVLEPEGLPAGLRERILDAGYRTIFANLQGEVFRAVGAEITP